jgi:hypothetical protein
MSQLRWLLLLHQIPPTPAYFRAKVLRRLNQLGALPIKNSAYLIPENDETKEDMEWLRSEIIQEGGEAWLFGAEASAGLSDAALIASFNELRSQDYKQLLDSSRAPEPEIRKLKRRFEEIRRIDFFGAPGREELQAMIANIESSLRGTSREPAVKPALAELKNRTWVTRRGVKVDRMSSAWLIRRFIDPAAQFRFVDPDRYTPAPGELRFDMFEGEFTHEGDLCTFEVLLKHAGLHDPGLNAIGELVHDIDLKDDKFQRPETSGIAAMISGIVALHAADERRVEEGGRLWESIYTALK